jgi:putative glycosyltransferase (TIGR04372 family)
MYSRMKNAIAIVLLDLFGGPIVWVVLQLAKTQVSPNPVARGLGLVPFQVLDYLMGADMLRLISYVSLRERKRRVRPRIRNRRLRSQLYLAVAAGAGKLEHAPTPAEFRADLLEENLDVERQYALGHQLFQSGQLALACETFQDLAERRVTKQPLEQRVQLLRDCGTSAFMLGRIEQANHYWGKAGELRRFVLGEESGPTFRIVGSSWFAAIGHVAMLDFYTKYNRLYRGDQVRVVAQVDLSGVPGNYLCERLGESGIDFIPMGRLQPDYDRWAKRNSKRRWDQLTSAERFAHVDDFWEFEFPDGQVLGYTHAASRIQQDWERQNRAPLLSVTDEERSFLDRALHMLGLPKDAWYVCLHVREPGFHQSWNARYPSMRDANVEDYRAAIELIVQRGGWVIRMGDPTMKPLPPMPNVIDYAHSTLKTPKADILISLGCRFFLGTNSGFATIPAIYGVRCVFSNWLPIGLPLWPSHDLVAPKLFWKESEMRYLTLQEIFESGLAFIQNWSDLPRGIKVRDNTPDDIRALTAEALGDAAALPESEVARARAAYRRIAEANHSYVGSTLSASFIAGHQDVFLPPEQAAGVTVEPDAAASRAAQLISAAQR